MTAVKKWKGGGALQLQSQPPQVLLERQFQERANSLFDGLMCWDTTQSQLEQGWQEVVALRSLCMQAYGGVADEGQTDWKNPLYAAFCKQHKRSCTKTDMQFEVLEVAGVSPGQPSGFISSLTCIDFSQKYTSHDIAVTKKRAEQLAAKMAFECEFPEAYAAFCQGSGIPATTYAPTQSVPQGNKRKAAEQSPEVAPKDFKTRLTHATYLLVDKSLSKGDIRYDTSQAEDGAYVSTVTLQVYDPSVGYTGRLAASSKQAEASAADAALTALALIIEPAEEAHKQKKLKKNRETLAALKERTKAKKAAGGAVGAAAL